MKDVDRQSNIELLRIIAIFFVLVGHVGVVEGLPECADFSSSPLSSVFKVFFGSIAVCGVDIFVLISGWFGIRPNIKGLAKFVYQVFFLLWAIYFFLIICGETCLSLRGIMISLALVKEYWFVMAYLGLYILSPVLNAFVIKVSKKQLQNFLFVFYAFQCYCCWLSGFYNYFEGYSIVFFCGLYLTARYFRLYPLSVVKGNGFKIYSICSLVIMLIATLGLWQFGYAFRMLRYDNPLVILASIALLSFFTRFNFQSKFVNKCAKSCFAVYVIHFNPYVFKYFKWTIQYLDVHFCGILYVFLISIFLICVFCSCYMLDQLRQMSWGYIQKS